MNKNDQYIIENLVTAYSTYIRSVCAMVCGPIIFAVYGVELLKDTFQ